MSVVSDQPRAKQSDTQSVQSATVQRVSSRTDVQQQRSSSQAARSERSGRSELSGNSGRVERQRIQRSESSTRSSSSLSERGYRGGGRVVGQFGLGSHQHYSGGSGLAYGGAAGGSYGASGGSYGAGGGSYGVGGGSYGASGGSYGAGGGSFGSAASGGRRQGRHRRQVIRLPDQSQGQVRQVRHRLPTPEPDLLERVYIQRMPGEVVEEITEIPTTPPPRVQERTVLEPSGPPQLVKRVVRVPPRSGSFGGYQQQQGAGFQGGNSFSNQGGFGGYQQQGAGFQGGSNFSNQGGYGGYQQQQGAGFQGGSSFSNQGGYGGYQQQQGAGFQDCSSLFNQGSYGGYPQQQQDVNYQASSNLLSAGSYVNVQQAASSYQPLTTLDSYQQHIGDFSAASAGASYSGGYSGAATVGGGYGSVDSGYQQQQGFSLSGGAGGYSSQSVSPPVGCHPAFCFYV